MSNPSTAIHPGIEKSPEICGGDARIAGTRIPVWLLVAYRNDGLSDLELLKSYPTITAEDLEHVWGYATLHAEEISLAIRENGNEA